MTARPIVALGLACLAIAGLAGCAPEPSDDLTGSCSAVIAQASYETMRQLAGAGLASSPDELRGALPERFRSGTDNEVTLPDHATVEKEFSDAEQAELRSALSSKAFGVGAVFDEQALLAALNESGACSSWLDAD